MIPKPGTPSNLPTKTLIFNWVKKICNDAPLKLKVEDLGDGVVYCKIINHYFSGIISTNRLNPHPKTQYQNTINLKLFQNGLTQLKINIPFDVSKVAKQKFLENWGLINSLYRHLVLNNEDLSVTGNNNQDSKTHYLNSYKPTPKRTFQAAFSDQIINQEEHLHNFGYGKSKNVALQSKPSIPVNTVLPINVQNRQNVAFQKPIYGNSYLPQNYSYENYNQNIHQNQNRSTFQNYQNQINQNNSHFYSVSNQLLSRPPLCNKDSLISNNYQMNKCWSVGKIYKEAGSSNEQKFLIHNQGKYSVNSHIFQSNYSAVIDRVKQILLKASHDIQKIRQIKMLLNIPLNQEIVKVQQQQNQQPSQKMISALYIPTKQSIEGNTSMVANDIEKQELKSKSLSNQNFQIGSKSVSSSEVKQMGNIQKQASGKKIRNNWNQNNFWSFRK